MFYIEVFIATSTPLALSSVITNSKSVKGLPDFSIASAYVNKTGKCFLLLVENNLFTQSASDSPPVFFHDIIKRIFCSLVKIVWFFTVTLQIPNTKWKKQQHTNGPLLIFSSEGIYDEGRFKRLYWKWRHQSQIIMSLLSPYVCLDGLTRQFSIDENFPFTWLAKR